LNTFPPEANVFLDGTLRGKTPLVLEDVAPGERQLKIVLPDYKPEQLIVSVKSGVEGSTHFIQLDRAQEPSPTATAHPSPSGSTGNGSSLPAATASPEVSTTPSPKESATPNESSSVSPSSTPLSRYEIDATREEVIKRIDALPGITAKEKTNLINKMYKARSMERLTVIHFDVGQSSLQGAAADELMKTFDKPELRDKLNDPTIILVAVGYADPGGRADLNLRISQERAENVSKILKQRAKLFNAIQTIGMGGTELLDSKRPDQNRAVEVWAVVPL
jgi:outer membrane protein OmpA-like peptidoglycan-associated protein